MLADTSSCWRPRLPGYRRPIDNDDETIIYAAMLLTVSMVKRVTAGRRRHS